MKYPKLHNYALIVVLLTGFNVLFSQAVIAPSLISNLGSDSTITVCASDTVTFTASGDTDGGLLYEFYLIRNGTTSSLNSSTGPQNSATYTGNHFLDDDQVFTRIWNTTQASATALTNTITINVNKYPSLIGLVSNQTGNVICNREEVIFTASSVSTNVLYHFFIDGISIQGPSTLSTLSHTFSSAATATLITSLNDCSRIITLPMHHSSLSAGSIIGGGNYCFGDSPSVIRNVQFGTYKGSQINSSTSSLTYQWESSTANNIWHEIIGANNVEYTPPSMIQTTHFRRKIVTSLNGKICSLVSNPITIIIIPELSAGKIMQSNQYFCLGDNFPSLTVSNSLLGGNIRYQWQQSTSSAATFTNINNATDVNYTPSSLVTTTLFRRATFSTAGSGCTTYTQAIRFTLVDLNPGSLDTSQNTNLCYNTIPNVISSGASGSQALSTIGTITYQWQQSINNTTWTSISSATQQDYYSPALLENTYFRRIAYSTIDSFVCSATTNVILFSVYNEVRAGSILGDQTICEESIPTPLSISDSNSPTGTRFRWEMSNDNVVFQTIGNTSSTLTFQRSSSWYPDRTSYYRVIMTTPQSCLSTSTVAKITVIPSPKIIQIQGPSQQQEVCPNTQISTVTFTTTGSVTNIVSNASGTGLALANSGNGGYMLSGIPTAPETTITLRAETVTPCLETIYTYRIYHTSVATTPTFIRKNEDTSLNTVFMHNGLWYNNTLCQTSLSTATSFFVCDSNISSNIPVYQWRVEPSSAGVINSTNGSMSWNLAFSGTATISVRSLGCGGNSNWLSTPIEVLPSSPADTTSSLTTPIAIDQSFCSRSTGAIPLCQITDRTSNTQFFATSTSGRSDYQSILWNIENIVPGGGIGGVTSPGTVTPTTGEFDWNTGFYGRFDLVAQAVNCDGTNGVTSRRTIQIAAANNSVPNILTVSPTLIPNCPPQGNYATQFISSQPVNWSIDNLTAGTFSSVQTNSLSLIWANDFSGTVRLTAAANGACETGSSELLMLVPGPANLQTLTGLEDVQLCQGEYLNGIPYTISGFPSTAIVNNLPAGITGTLSATHHIVDIVYSGTASTGQTYRLEIFGQLYEYTTSGADTADQVTQGLANAVNASQSHVINATRVSTNTLRIQPIVTGVTLSGTVLSITGSVRVTSINLISSPQRVFTLTGTVTAAPGQYDYTVTTEGGANFCRQISRIGRINVVGTSSLTLSSSSSTINQQLCKGNSLIPITYKVAHAVNAVVTGLPNGLTYQYRSGVVTISGTPLVNISTPTSFNYTVKTTNNVSGCSPEASLSGQISLIPQHSITLQSSLGTNNQMTCGNSFTPIVYSLAGGATSAPLVAGLPPGISATYSPTARTLTLSGTITTSVSTLTYSYTVTTTGNNCVTEVAEGTITILPNPSIALSSLGTTTSQALCDQTLLTPIRYELNHSRSFVVNGLPKGVTAVQSGNELIISGTPNENVTTTTVYNYELTTSGSSCQPEVSTTGSITVYPAHQIRLTSGSANQTVCAGALTPIIYTLEGGATTAPTVGGLPPGVSATYSSTARTFTLSGTITSNVITPTAYTYTVTTTGNSCSPKSVQGNITLLPNPSFTLSSVATTTQQELCDQTAITPIRYQLNNSNGFTISGLPVSLSVNQSGNEIAISGTLNENVTTTTVYNYELTTSGSSCQPEVSTTGSITVYPAHQIRLTSGSANQTVCAVGLSQPLTPIIYSLEGGATLAPVIDGLPPGILTIYNASARTFTLSGTITSNVTNQTAYTYTVTTTGNSCTPKTVQGNITLLPNPRIDLVSDALSIDQTDNNAVCNQTSIDSIQYRLNFASSYVITGLPAGVSVSQSGDIVTISGSPNETVTSTTVFTYTLTTTGSTCDLSVSVNGRIGVIPTISIDQDYIEQNDITAITCQGGEDGAIKIPTSSPALDLRIQNGVPSIAQRNQIILINQPQLGDVYTLNINTIPYQHTVINSSFGGPIQTLTQVANSLADLVNSATGFSESEVTVNLLSTSTLELVADVAGTAFSANLGISTTASTNSPTFIVSETVANFTSELSYLWSGPNNFTSSNLQIEHLKTGTYTLRVSAGNCTSEASFFISEPEPIVINNNVCNGSFRTTISGGTPPYQLSLYDSSGNLLKTNNTSSIYDYNNLTPGANYRLDIRDASCSVPKQFAITLPFELQYDASLVSLIHDYCQQVPNNTGEGAIQLVSSNGNAFTGGSGNFSYRWTGPTGTILSRDLQNLIPGEYTVTVTDNELGCSRSETFSILSNQPLTAIYQGNIPLDTNNQINLTCFDDLTTLSVNVTGGFGTYQYAWLKDGVGVSNGNSHQLVNAGQGTYTLVISEVAPANVNVNGSCQLIQVYKVIAPDKLIAEVLTTSITQAKCVSETISIPVKISGGTPPYTLSLNNVEKVTTSNSSYTFQNIFPHSLGSTVSFTVTDQNNCHSNSSTFTINIPEQYDFNSSVQSINCVSNRLGEVQLTSSPTINPSSHLIVRWMGKNLDFLDTWQNGNGKLENLTQSGTYSVTIRNQEGCLLYTNSFEVENLSGSSLKASITQTNSPTNCSVYDGRIAIEVTEGYPPYTVQWERKTGQNTWTLISHLTNHLFTDDLSFGVYRVLISDSSQGTTTLCDSKIILPEITLGDPTLNLLVPAPIPYQFNTMVTQVDCVNNGLGAIEIVAIPSITASAPLIVSWFGGGKQVVETWTSSKTSLRGISENGAYTVSVTNQMGCTLFTESFEIQQVKAATLAVSITAVTTPTNCATNDGQLTLQVTNTGLPFSIQWERKTSQTTWTHIEELEDQLIVSNLYEGIYRAIVINSSVNVSSSNCVSRVISKEIILGENRLSLLTPTPINYAFNAEVTQIDCQNDGAGSILLRTNPIINENQIFGVEWEGPNFRSVSSWSSTTHVLDQISQAGSYAVTVTNQQGCALYVRSFDINDMTEELLRVSVSSIVTPSHCASRDGKIVISLRDGYPPYKVQWERKTGINSWTLLPEYNDQLNISGLSKGIYRANVTDSSLASTTESCRSSLITEEISLGNDSFNLIGPQPITYTFNKIVRPVECDPAGIGSIELTASPSIENEEVLMIEWRGGNRHLFNTWSGGNETLTNIISGETYTVTVTNQQGCVLYEETIRVESQIQFPLIEVSNISHVSHCGGNDGQINLSISEGVSPNNLVWQFSKDQNNWVDLAQFNNELIINNLIVGFYRAIARRINAPQDDIICSNTTTSSIIEIEEPSISLNSFWVDSLEDCLYAETIKVSFTISTFFPEGIPPTNRNLKFYLDNEEVILGSEQLIFNEQTDVYLFNQIKEGTHLLTISTNEQPLDCKINHEFTVSFDQPITFTGQRIYHINPCLATIPIEVSLDDIKGGVPYESNDGHSYELQWDFLPKGIKGGSGVIEQFVGYDILSAEAGTYTLTILDENGCTNSTSSPVIIEVFTPEEAPFKVQGKLINPEFPSGERVKFLSPSCNSGGTDGEIGVEITGGIRPFQIQWFKQSVIEATNTSSLSAGFVEIEEAANKTHLTDLTVGKYKIQLSSSGISCPATATNKEYVYYEEIIDVVPNPKLKIISGPFVDGDLCNGLPGRVLIEIFDNNQGALSFFYAGDKIQIEEDAINDQTYTLLIEDPQESEVLRIVNEEGCYLEETIDLRMGESNFSFSSASLLTTGIVLEREEVLFENNSTEPYIRSEWDFGDNSPVLHIPILQQPERITHEYLLSGSYTVHLRIFNEAGCFNESSQRISIGEGYSIVLPNVFTPNNDGINDRFKPLFSGFSEITFSVYDYLGNLIYSEHDFREKNNVTKALAISGWDGLNPPVSPYFIYSVTGTLLDGTTQIERTGTFSLLR